jgi:DNA-binding LacI/PurR family transcriptional regulator
MRKSVTLLDIAQTAGVSKATAARALSSRGYVAEEARRRVTEAARRLGYRPNVVARGFRSQRSFTIGHIAHAITENPFFAHVARSVEMEAIANGYKVFLYNQNGTSEHERAGVERFIERRVDAIILTYAIDVENLTLLKEAGIPVVQIEREQTGDTHAVLVDNRAGTASAMRHLLELGHRRVAFIGGDPARYPRSLSRGCSVEEERLGMYVDSLREAGVSVDPRLIELDEYIALSEDGSNLAGYRGMKTILEEPERPTAVFVGCDILAAGALQAIYEARLRIPDDISVVGYDDTLAASLAPRLTTVAQPMADLGRTAIRLALSEIADPEIKPKTVTLSPRLVVRDSTASPPAEN